MTYKTAWRDGKLPIPAEQMPTGTVIVHPPSEAQSAGVALYARVSSVDQQADLDRQLARLSEYAARSGLYVVEAVKEVGSGLNGHRRAMLRLLRDPKVQTRTHRAARPRMEVAEPMSQTDRLNPQQQESLWEIAGRPLALGAALVVSVVTATVLVLKTAGLLKPLAC